MKERVTELILKIQMVFPREECVVSKNQISSNSKSLSFLVISDMAFCFAINHKNKLAYEFKEYRSSQSCLKYAKEGLTHIIIVLHIHVLTATLGEICGMIIIL